MFRNIMSSWLTVLLTRMKCPYFSDFSLKSSLSDTRIRTPVCFLIPFAWQTFSSFHFKVTCIFEGDL